MPKRLITLAIVVFWLGMAGLFFHEQLWPRLMPSEPAMFPVDIVDEAGPQLETTSWLVTKNGGEGYRANTDWEYVPDTDTFRSHCQLNRAQRLPELPRDVGGAWLPQFHKVAMNSYYYLTRGGQMTGIDTTTAYTLAVPALSADGLAVSAKLGGNPHAGRLVPAVELSFPIPVEEKASTRLRPEAVKREAAPVVVSPRGIVLNPLHPPRRMADLRPGQRWQVTLVDPFALLDLAGCLGSVAGEQMRRAGIADDAAADVLEARVLPDLETQVWTEKNDEQVTCRVIKCTGEGPFPALTLWVRERDGMIFKQEATTRSGDVWTFVRRPFNYRMQQAPNQPESFAFTPARAASVFGQSFAAAAAAPAAPAAAMTQHLAALGATQIDAWDPPGHRQ